MRGLPLEGLESRVLCESEKLSHIPVARAECALAGAGPEFAFRVLEERKEGYDVHLVNKEGQDDPPKLVERSHSVPVIPYRMIVESLCGRHAEKRSELRFSGRVCMSRIVITDEITAVFVHIWLKTQLGYALRWNSPYCSIDVPIDFAQDLSHQKHVIAGYPVSAKVYFQHFVDGMCSIITCSCYQVSYGNMRCPLARCWIVRIIGRALPSGYFGFVGCALFCAGKHVLQLADGPRVKKFIIHHWRQAAGDRDEGVELEYLPEDAPSGFGFPWSDSE